MSWAGGLDCEARAKRSRTRDSTVMAVHRVSLAWSWTQNRRLRAVGHVQELRSAHHDLYDIPPSHFVPPQCYCRQQFDCSTPQHRWLTQHPRLLSLGRCVQEPSSRIPRIFPLASSCRRANKSLNLFPGHVQITATRRELPKYSTPQLRRNSCRAAPVTAAGKGAEGPCMTD